MAESKRTENGVGHAFRPLYKAQHWMYRKGRPGLVARVANRLAAILFSRGLFGERGAATLEVTGRHSGRAITFPVVVAEYLGESYLVSMLGNDASWARNVRAAGGRAALLRGGREEVRLEEVPAAERAPILKQYLASAPGARPHLPVDWRAPLEDFEGIAAEFPAFRIVPGGPGSGESGRAGTAGGDGDE